MSEGALRGLESQWHKIYIAWHSILGQLKVKQRAEENQSLSGARKNKLPRGNFISCPPPDFAAK